MATQLAPSDEERRLSPEEIERHWFETVYQGDRLKQLTARAGIMGMGLGMVMACSNVYVGLKAGWSMGVAITSCVLAYVAFEAVTGALRGPLVALGRVPVVGVLFRWLNAGERYSILENNAMQSAASAAGMMAGGGLVNAIPALMMLNPGAIPADFQTRCLWLIPWVAVISCLGVFLAVPAKRQMINVEQLPFPSGIAAATTLRTLHETGGDAAMQAKSLGIAGLLGAGIAWLRDSGDLPWMKLFPIRGAPDWSPVRNFFAPAKLAWLRLPRVESVWGTSWIKLGTFKGAPLGLNRLTMSFEGSLLFVAAGAIMGFRQAWSLMLGAVINYVILAPRFLSAGVIAAPSFRQISGWSLWIGVPMMVTSGLLLFFMNWRSVVRAFGTITAFLGARPAADDAMDRIEVPGSWFVIGYAVLGAAAIALGARLFHIHWWMGLIAVLATFLLVVVAARATGETDITPTGPLSKITQLSFGAIAPGNISTNLMTANISAGAVTHAGDLLTDLKSGYLLGANPRQQFLAQFLGVLAGSLIVVPIYFVLIPDPNLLGGEKWPAPAALVWRGVAELLARGVGALPPSARVGLVIGALVGIALPLLEKAFPRQRRFIPSATGVGLAFTINGFNSISMFIGACLALWLSKAKPKLHERYTIPVSSGIIAGESLMGVAIALLTIVSGGH
ncbi:MAG TPA: OPT family oligopeptide transporter [Candidatus Eisenbacteria bacterium]|nr:OPT family oligopeptide transporter [Candidatus Eisenbacteria bacterium]